MKETTKSLPLRLELNHFEKYLHGNGIDIGCGPDILQVPAHIPSHITPFDRPQGDAELLEIIRDNHFDFAYSSHCLEHIGNVPRALYNWCRVIKPGGFLFVVVPDFFLYEKGFWPSRFNRDHKASFSLTIKAATNQQFESNHYHISNVKHILKTMDMEFIEAEIEDTGYDYELPNTVDQTLNTNTLAQIRIIAQKKITAI